MIFDFDFHQVMRLSNIKRWGIMEMSREQSVAEHSYNVAMMTQALCKEMEMDEDYAAICVEWALAHDLPEVVTGDMPTPLKQFDPDVFISLESRMFPEYTEFEDTIMGRGVRAIVKVADYIDAIQFAEKFCVDSRKPELMEELRYKLDKSIVKIQYMGGNVNKLVSLWLD